MLCSEITNVAMHKITVSSYVFVLTGMPLKVSTLLCNKFGPEYIGPDSECYSAFFVVFLMVQSQKLVTFNPLRIPLD